MPVAEQLESFAVTPPVPVVRADCYHCGQSVDRDTLRAAPNNRQHCRACFLAECRVCTECNRVVWAANVQRDGLCDTCRCASDCWPCTPMDVSIATYDKIASKRKYGVEVETSECNNYRQIKGDSLFGAKYDCSVSGMEFISPILYGDEGLAEIDKFFDLADERDFEVDGDCGLHIHLDMRDETTVQLRHVAYAYAKSYAAWRGLVSEWRANDCNYCHAPSYSASDIKGCAKIKRWMAGTDRYNYMNFVSYGTHGTFECRMMDGSVDRVAVKKWILAHTRFIDAVKDKTYAQIDVMFEGDARSQFETLLGIWNRAGGDNINSYYRRKFRIHAASSVRRDDDDNWDD